MADNQETKEAGTSLVVGSVGTLKQILVNSQRSIASVLPSHMSADRLVKLAVLAAVQQPKLLLCTKESVLGSLMTAAQLGLEPNGMLGSGYLVPYKVKGVMTCQFIPGYRGLVDLAKRSGEVAGVVARVVYNDDTFEVHYGTKDEIVHRPALGGSRKYSDIFAVYVIATFEGGHKQFEVMTKEEVDAIRARSKSAEDGPWVSDYEEMAKKTVTKRGAKYWPLSPQKAAQFAQAVEHDNRVDFGAMGGLDPARDTEEGVAASVREKTANDMENLKQRMGGAKAATTKLVPEHPGAAPEKKKGETQEDFDLRYDDWRVSMQEFNEVHSEAEARVAAADAEEQEVARGE